MSVPPDRDFRLQKLRAAFRQPYGAVIDDTVTMRQK